MPRHSRLSPCLRDPHMIQWDVRQLVYGGPPLRDILLIHSCKAVDTDLPHTVPPRCTGQSPLAKWPLSKIIRQKSLAWASWPVSLCGASTLHHRDSGTAAASYPRLTSTSASAASPLRPRHHLRPNRWSRPDPSASASSGWCSPDRRYGSLCSPPWVLLRSELRAAPLGALPDSPFDPTLPSWLTSEARARYAPQAPPQPSSSFPWPRSFLIFFRLFESRWWILGSQPHSLGPQLTAKLLQFLLARLVMAASKACPPSWGSTSIKYPSFELGAAGFAFRWRAALSRARWSLRALHTPTLQRYQLSALRPWSWLGQLGPTGLNFSNLAISSSRPLL